MKLIYKIDKKNSITADVRYKSPTSLYKILTSEEGHNFPDWHDMCTGQYQLPVASLCNSIWH